VSEFYDSGKKAYWDPDNPYASVKTAGSGLRITLLKALADGMSYKIWVH
jgi:hypothetical protein